MAKILRIVFTLLATLCLIAAIPLGIFFELAGIIGAALGALLFFGLMMLCKQKQEASESKNGNTATFIPDNSDNSEEKPSGTDSEDKDR